VVVVGPGLKGLEHPTADSGAGGASGQGFGPRFGVVDAGTQTGTWQSKHPTSKRKRDRETANMLVLVVLDSA
jgi:hypothetical protein